jgi:hypothetical protein
MLLNETLFAGFTTPFSVTTPVVAGGIGLNHVLNVDELTGQTSVAPAMGDTGTQAFVVHGSVGTNVCAFSGGGGAGGGQPPGAINRTPAIPINTNLATLPEIDILFSSPCISAGLERIVLGRTKSLQRIVRVDPGRQTVSRIGGYISGKALGGIIWSAATGR